MLTSTARLIKGVTLIYRSWSHRQFIYPTSFRKPYSSTRVLFGGPIHRQTKPKSSLHDLLKAGEFDQVLGVFESQRSSMGSIQLSMMFNEFGKTKMKHSMLKQDRRFQTFVQHVTIKFKSPIFFNIPVLKMLAKKLSQRTLMRT